MQAKRKAIMLVYQEGSENWAHQDNNHAHTAPDCYQAVLVCSCPGEDFQGGEFYISRQCGPSSSEHAGVSQAVCAHLHPFTHILL